MVADGQGVPLACRTESASPAEVTLVEGVLEEVAVGEEPTPLIADQLMTAINSARTWRRRVGTWSVRTAEDEFDPRRKMDGSSVAIAAVGRSNARFRGSAPSADSSFATNTTASYIKALSTWPAS